MFKKLVWEKRLLKKVYKLFSVTTVIFGIFAFFILENWLFLALMQGSMSLMMLFMGMDTILLKKQKILGYLMFVVSAFLFFVMINGIIRTI
ncbi:hypothetical protein [Desulfosporosinus sp. SB140]|uniref:hypothetical protein n=1 Tax=Desulfosporosinus paludis TaxID=3115649 RepID=UPI00388F465A